jgi:hypothetical protein
MEAAAREQARLDALARHGILDSGQEASYDRLTRLAQRLFDVPIATLNFIDGHRQWFKSRQGFSACETDRDSAFCNITIQQPAQLIVTDAFTDERFARNEFVLGEPHIRFYAGIPLKTHDGHAIGSLCAVGPRPRSFSADDEQTLSDLGGLAMELLDLRRQAAAAEPGAGLISPREVLKAGRIVFNNSRIQMRCTVRQLSKDGAVAQVMSTSNIPERVALIIDADATSRLCTVSGRTPQALTLSFES